MLVIASGGCQSLAVISELFMNWVRSFILTSACIIYTDKIVASVQFDGMFIQSGSHGSYGSYGLCSVIGIRYSLISSPS